LFTLAALVIPSAATASPGPVVARGISPAGIPWRIKLGLSYHGQGGVVDFRHFTPASPFPAFRYRDTLQLPILPRLVFTANRGGDAPPAIESDLSGFAKRAVSTLEVRMTDGTTLSISAQRPTVNLGHKWRWARKLSFFDVFFPNTQTPSSITALDAAGQALATSNTRPDGMFFGLRPR
jgi:hypothetical protein